MKSKSQIFGIIIVIINLALAARLIAILFEDGDKTIIAFAVSFVMLFTLNLIIGAIIRIWNKSLSRYFLKSGVVMAILFLPILFIVPFIVYEMWK